jgi:probable HAF family extracellular repeat protein
MFGRVIPAGNGWYDMSGYGIDPKTGKPYFWAARFNGKGKQVGDGVVLPAPNLGMAENTGRAKDPFFVGTNSSDYTNNLPEQAILWNPDTGGPISLGTLDPSNANAFSNAMDVSDTGQIVVGFSDFNNGTTQHALGWTQAGGIVDLSSANGASGFSRAFGVSGNGGTAVGDSDFPSGPRRAFLWTQANGFQSLGSINGAPSVATAITDDASVVVGQAYLGSGNSAAFRWTQAGGLVSLGALSGDGDDDAAATGVSDNGKIVVGVSAARPLTLGNLSYDWGTDTHGFRWTQQTGMQDFTALLSAGGVDMTGIEIVAITGISPDGQFIIGQATTPTTGPNGTVAFLAQVCDDNIGTSCVLPPLTAVPASGHSPLAVSFSESGLPPPMTYTVNFGDGTTGPFTQSSCDGNPPVDGAVSIQCSGTAHHTYTTAGTYTATLLNTSGDTFATAKITVGGNLVQPLVRPTPAATQASPPVTTSMPMTERHSPDQ